MTGVNSKPKAIGVPSDAKEILIWFFFPMQSFCHRNSGEEEHQRLDCKRNKIAAPPTPRPHEAESSGKHGTFMTKCLVRCFVGVTKNPWGGLARSWMKTTMELKNR